MLNVNNNQVYRLNSDSSPLCSKPRRKFVQTSYSVKVQLIGLIFDADSKGHAHSVTHSQLRKPQHTYLKRAIRKAQFKLNRAFRVIRGHPYLCQQESRTVYCRNVQLMPTLFLKLTKIWQWDNGKFVDFNDPLKFEYVPASRNAFEYLQMTYIARN